MSCLVAAWPAPVNQARFTLPCKTLQLPLPGKRVRNDSFEVVEPRHNAQQFPDRRGVGNDARRVAFAAAGFDNFEWLAGNAGNAIDHLAHGESLAVAAI